MRTLHEGYTIFLDQDNLILLKDELMQMICKTISVPIKCMIKNEHNMYDGIIISLNMLSKCAIIKTGISTLWAIPLINNISIYENQTNIRGTVGGLSSDSATRFCE